MPNGRIGVVLVDNPELIYSKQPHRKIILHNDNSEVSTNACQLDDLVGTERSHGDRINKLLTYEAENCRPFYMQTLPDSEGTPWNKNDK